MTDLALLLRRELIAPPPPEGARGAELPRRLQEYARYVSVVAEQLEAQERGNDEKARRLAAERREIEERIAGDRTRPAREEGWAGSHERFPSLLREAMRELEAVGEREALGESARAHWGRLHDEALALARDIRPQGGMTGRYVEVAKPSSLDVRF